MGATPRVSVITPIRAETPGDVELLGKAIKSVMAQEYKDWEMVIVNDHSSQSLRPLAKLFSDDRITGVSAKNRGVCHARNQAAQMSRGGLLLGLDADDNLPANSLADLVPAYKPKTVVYGSCLILLPDAQRVHKPPNYNFNMLLRTLMMPIGSLHAKSDWKRAGGWNPIMEDGLEDWEYWVHLGELGVCGKRVDSIVYVYNRRNRPHSRIVKIHKTPNARTEAYHRMRNLHIDTYNGRRPVGCCGGSTAAAMPSIATARKPAPAQSLKIPLAAIGNNQLQKVRYVGDMMAEFGIVGQVSGIRYTIPGKGELLEITEDGRVGVDSRDIPFFLRANRGRDFQVV